MIQVSTAQQIYSCFGKFRCRSIRIISAELLDFEQFYVEDQSRIRRNDRWVAVRAIGEIARDDQTTFPADFHREHSFVPTRDDLSYTDRSCEWLHMVEAWI